MSANHQALAQEHGIPTIDATDELALDAKTRRNMAKLPAESLTFAQDGVLATIELPGDGVGAPRGVVSVLAPSAAKRRGLFTFKRMHPFEAIPDPCRWPTISMIDDERFTPDRTWEEPERDDIYKAAMDEVNRASNEALRSIVLPPANALAAIRVAPWTYDSIPQLRDPAIQIRGALWLAGPPIPSVSPFINIIESQGKRDFVPLHGPNLAGALFVHAPVNWRSEQILEELCKLTHAKLVRELAVSPNRRDPDLIAAHVAWALALDRITPDEAKLVRFRCFRPNPLDPAALLAHMQSRESIIVVTPESKYGDACLVDDGSETARVLRNVFGARMRSPTQRMRPDTVEPPPPPPVAIKHPLQPFVDRLHGRITSLGIPVAFWRIVDDREKPLVEFTDGVLELAARNKYVLETAGAVAANTAWSADALDALAAHCVTVLNVALTSITDAAEGRAIGKLLA
jgi:hypothetical protein